MVMEMKMVLKIDFKSDEIKMVLKADITGGRN